MIKLIRQFTGCNGRILALLRHTDGREVICLHKQYTTFLKPHKFDTAYEAANKRLGIA